MSLQLLENYHISGHFADHCGLVSGFIPQTISSFILETIPLSIPWMFRCVSNVFRSQSRFDFIQMVSKCLSSWRPRCSKSVTAGGTINSPHTWSFWQFTPFGASSRTLRYLDIRPQGCPGNWMDHKIATLKFAAIPLRVTV